MTLCHVRELNVVKTVAVISPYNSTYKCTSLLKDEFGHHYGLNYGLNYEFKLALCFRSEANT